MWEEKDSSMTETIYIPLEDEGTDVWRPVAAEPDADGMYRVLDDGTYDPDVETWRFPPGSVVFCEPRVTSRGQVLAATRLADQASAKRAG